MRPASVGATLDSDAERLLRASFDAADTAHRGTLTREEAQAGGFGWITNHFDAIDTQRAGRVSFDDVKRYYKSRGQAAPAATTRSQATRRLARFGRTRAAFAAASALRAAIHGSTSFARIGLANR